MTTPTTPIAENTPSVAASDTPAAAATDAAPTAASSEPGQVWSIAETAPSEDVNVIATQGIRDGIASQSKAAGSVVDTLDAAALSIGHMRVSLFDILLVVGVIALVITGAILAIRMCKGLLGRVTGFDSTQRLLAEKLSTMIVWGLAFFIGIDLLGIDLTAFAVFGGAFGLAIGFGLQKTFGNLISGILLLMDKSIKPGDVITVTDGSGAESFGQIRKIGIRAISVITRDQTEYLIPNENLMINQVVNWSYSSRDVRVKAPVGVSYNSDLVLVEKLLQQAVDETKRILQSPKARILIMGFGDSSVDFEIRFWIQDPEEGLTNIRSDVYKRVWRLFKENDIEIPFPQRDLHLRSSKQMDQLLELMNEKNAD